MANYSRGYGWDPYSQTDINDRFHSLIKNQENEAKNQRQNYYNSIGTTKIQTDYVPTTGKSAFSDSCFWKVIWVFIWGGCLAAGSSFVASSSNLNLIVAGAVMIPVAIISIPIPFLWKYIPNTCCCPIYQLLWFSLTGGFALSGLICIIVSVQLNKDEFAIGGYVLVGVSIIMILITTCCWNGLKSHWSNKSRSMVTIVEVQTQL